MKIVMLSRLFCPHIGGVEKHVCEISKLLVKKGYEVSVITEKFDKNLKNRETINGVKIIRFSCPRIKFIGLFLIWLWLWKNRRLITQSDIVHCHDVFIWYLPFKFIFKKKVVYTTFHGWEGVWPIPYLNIFQKRVAKKLSTGCIAVGKYIEKYYGIKSDGIVYGGVDRIDERGLTTGKSPNSIVFLGRLEKDTGIMEFLKRLEKNEKYIVDFCGDGSMRKECEKYGKVHGFVDPEPLLRKASKCFAGGYLSAFEALVNGCRLWVGWENRLKMDYWKMSPFYRWVDSDNTEDATIWAKNYSWDKVLDKYLKLWGT